MTDDRQTTKRQLETTLFKNKICISFLKGFNLRHYSVVNDLNPSSRYLINVSQIPEDALKQRRLHNSIFVFHIFAIE